MRYTSRRRPDAAGEAAPAPAAKPQDGRALPRFLRADFERGGVDLSRVRVHDGPEADALARRHGAQALTVAEDIYFKAGHFAPGTEPGRRLLAHELTHTLQQAGAAPAAGAMRVSEPGDASEREADAQAARWLQGGTPKVTPMPAGVLSRQPDPQAGASAAAQPVPAAQAAAMRPPLYTSYFDQVVPGVLQAIEAHGDIPFDRALWLITQSYGEQSPLSVNDKGKVSYYLPSEHRNRLFNEHASVAEDKTPLPGQESEGVSIHMLAQKEFKNGAYVNAPSPTFGYDSTARSTEHHLALLKERRPGVYDSLKGGASFGGFVDDLKSSGYATEPAYVERLKGLQGQVAKQVGDWLKFRVPEMRERVERMVAYQAFLKDNLAGWQRRLASEPDPVGDNARQCASSQGLVDGMAIELAAVRADLARMERFAGSIKVKLPG
ncbi:eCIS core domain-containing protein [Variovorax saccharolyticus]|uniref:eCIS core domain-containing protein n=1 Tax=Variovorax saccharolyticus TaxID=3053516 RepID=UPI0025780AD8|nr:DUF4157 domain-containing protein [Variovorax sp. J31P216]MDM0028617.1 DUF4157 domain-containing protein [Variovorax sp. J31P216]